MESNVQTQTVVDPRAVAERLAQLEAASPGTIDRLVKLAAREELRECIEPIVDKVLEERGLPADPGDIPFGQDTGEDEPAADQPTTGVAELDEAINWETVDALALGYAFLKISWENNNLGDRLQVMLEHKLKPLFSMPCITNNPAGELDPDTASRAAWWLAITQGMEIGKDN